MIRSNEVQDFVTSWTGLKDLLTFMFMNFHYTRVLSKFVFNY